MKLSHIALLGLFTNSCALAGGSPKAASTYRVPQESKDALRQGEAKSEEIQEQIGAETEQLDRLEKDLTKALGVALGKESVSAGIPNPESSSAILKGLRASKIKLSIGRVLNHDGKVVNDNFMQLEDSYTKRVQELSRKIAEQKASKAEVKEVQDGAKYAMKLNDLRMQVMNLSLVTMQSNTHVQSSAMTTMLRVSHMVRTRKQMELEINDEDIGRVQEWLTRQRRAEAIAGTALAVMATYQAVINKNGDPRALDALAGAALSAVPIKVDVSPEDARAYVSELRTNVAAVKIQYETMMRKAHGDEKYERQYKASTDAMFRQAAEADQQKSAGQMVLESNKKYEEDLEKCARGEPISPGSLVSPVKCKEVKGTPLAKVLSLAGGAGSGSAAPGGDVLGGLSGLVPGLSAVQASLEGIQALQKGDPKGALGAAVGLVPGAGPLKQGLSLASKLLGI